jgi:phosphoribosylformylglycinamidine synthase subunit PurL
VSVDSVSHAEETPEKDQPYEALGLKKDEYEEIRRLLGRRPTSGELAMYSVMWSEHCSYKSSKIHLRQFGQKVTDDMRNSPHGGNGGKRRRRRYR